jgi:hypothetical protein
VPGVVGGEGLLGPEGPVVHDVDPLVQGEVDGAVGGVGHVGVLGALGDDAADGWNGDEGDDGPDAVEPSAAKGFVSPLSVPFGPVESDCAGPSEVDPSPPGEPPVAPEESPAGDVGPSLLDGAPDEPPPAAAELPSVVEFADVPPEAFVSVTDNAPVVFDGDVPVTTLPAELPPASPLLLPPAPPAAALAGSLVVIVPAVAVSLVLAALGSVASEAEPADEVIVGGAGGAAGSTVVSAACSGPVLTVITPGSTTGKIGPDSSPVVETVATAGRNGSDWTLLGGWTTESLAGNAGALSSGDPSDTEAASAATTIELSGTIIAAICTDASTRTAGSGTTTTGAGGSPDGATSAAEVVAPGEAGGPIAGSCDDVAVEAVAAVEPADAAVATAGPDEPPAPLPEPLTFELLATERGVSLADTADAVPVPTGFTAATRNT